MNKKIYLSLICVFAINAGANDLGVVQVESSTIDQKTETQISEVSSTTYIDSETIENINAKSVADILNMVPGVTMSLVGTDSLKVHIRGVDNQMYMGEQPGVAIVIDGVPVQETTGKINVDLDNIESIKVIKGGASYLYGNDAIAGAVIITTKKQKAKDNSKVEFETGSFGYRKGIASTNQSFENSALQLQGSYRDSDGYWDDAFVTVKSVNGKYQYYIDDTSDVTFGLDFTRRITGDGNSVSGITEAIVNPTSAGYASYGGYYNSDLTKGFITYSKDLDTDSNFMLRVHSYEDDKEYKITRLAYDMDEIWSQKGAKGEYRTALGSFALMGGFDIQRNETDEKKYDAIDGTVQRGSTADGDLLEDFKTKEDINAVYVEIKHQTTKELTSTFNIRYDDISHDYNDHFDSANNVNPDYSAFSYRIGFNYTLANSQAIYTNFSTGFRAPTVGQISQNQTSLAADPTLNIPSEIDLEKTYNYEIGYKGKMYDTFFNASVFQLDRKNYIGRIAGSYITSDDDEESNYDNVGDMRSRGFELSLNSDKTKTFSYDLAYTFLSAKFTNYTISQQLTVDPDGPYRPLTATYARTDLSGNYVPRTSKHTINLAVNYKVTPKFTISPEVYYRGSYYADEANQFKQGGYTVANLRVNYNYSDSLEFFGKVDNLFDRNYFEFVTVNSSAIATMEDSTIRVAEPRAFYAGMRYKF